MKNYPFAYIVSFLIGTFALHENLNAQKPEVDLNDLTTINISSYEGFKKETGELIRRMKDKTIVALGEGTHGTSEFYKVRYWISKILIEEHGFNIIALENDYGDSWLLNKAMMQKGVNLENAMKNNLLSIWRNEEVKEMLEWMRSYNDKRVKKVTLGGIDHVYLKPDADILDSLLKRLQLPEVPKLTA
ncbi:MAG: hypothetical protein EOO43_24510, partial [Flavobacterium sp.]